MMRPAVTQACLAAALVVAAGCLAGPKDREPDSSSFFERLEDSQLTSVLGKELVALPVTHSKASMADAYRLTIEEPAAPVSVRVGIVGPELPPEASWGLLALDLEDDGASQHWRWLSAVLPQGQEGWLGDGRSQLGESWIRHDFFLGYLSFFGFQNGPSTQFILMPFVQGAPPGQHTVLLAQLSSEERNSTALLPLAWPDVPLHVAPPIANNLDVSVAATYRPGCFFGCSSEVFFGPITHESGPCELPPPCESTWKWSHTSDLEGGISFFSFADWRYNGTWSRMAYARTADWSDEGVRLRTYSIDGHSDPLGFDDILASVSGSGGHAFSLKLNVFTGRPVFSYQGWAVDLDLEVLTGVPLEQFDRHQAELLPSLP